MFMASCAVLDRVFFPCSHNSKCNTHRYITSQLKGCSPVAVGQHCTRQPQQAFGGAFGVWGGLDVARPLNPKVGFKDGELEQRPW